MQVSKWGDGLAVRLPQSLVEELGLQAGDELELKAESPSSLVVRKVDVGADFLERIKSFNWTLPPDYKFDREEANER